MPGMRRALPSDAYSGNSSIIHLCVSLLRGIKLTSETKNINAPFGPHDAIAKPSQHHSSDR